MPETHHLKTHPNYYADVDSGAKTAELRRDDRDFAVGDTLVLCEWDPEMFAHAATDGSSVEEANEFAYTGRSVTVKVTHILRGGPWLASGYAMLSFHREAA